MIKRNTLLVFLTAGLVLAGCDYDTYHGYSEGAGVATYETHPHNMPARPVSSLPTAPSYGPPPANTPGGPSYASPGARGGDYGPPPAPQRGGPSYGN
jgi:hypothetical protein